MTQAEEYFHEIVKQIPNAKPSKMFGAGCIKMPNGKAGAMYWKEHLVAKLQGDDLATALSLEGAKEFSPMEGRPMKGWVQIPYQHKDHWLSYARVSASGVEKLKPNKK